MARTIVVTGAATGIGCALKESLIKQGDKIISVDIHSSDIEADLASDTGIKRAVESINQLCSDGVDGLVTCAGVGPNAGSSRLIAELNYFGSIQLIDSLKHLLAKRKGKVVAVASNSALLPGVETELVHALLNGLKPEALVLAERTEGAKTYAASKNALIRWIRANAPEYIRCGINLNVVAPGITKTPLTDGAFADAKYSGAMDQFLKMTPYGEIGTPEMIAKPIEFLLSDNAKFMVGSMLVVDGGTDALIRSSQF